MNAKRKPSNDRASSGSLKSTNEIGEKEFKKDLLPKTTPVNMFHKPENTRVVDSDMELLTARAIMSGSSVPRSPREPDISDRGDLRNVETLFVWS